MLYKEQTLSKMHTIYSIFLVKEAVYMSSLKVSYSVAEVAAAAAGEHVI
ncbi:MAG: hypothetical protein LBC49_05510 [Bacteroidales bacterium]|jgi:hypothetical protein|nr:hypothetical protein [Bacteroidales bacterium]